MGSNTSEKMALLVRWEQAGKDTELPSSMCLCSPRAEGVAQLKACLLVWRSGLEVYVFVPENLHLSWIYLVQLKQN